MFFPFDRATEVLEAWRSARPGLPDELTSWANVVHVPDLPFVPEPVRGGSFAVVSGAFCGDAADGAPLLAPIRELGPAMDTFAMVPPVALAELAMDPPDPLPYLSTHSLTGELPVEAIEEIVAAVPRESGIVSFQIRDLGGALATAPVDAGARATIDATLCMFAVGIAPNADAGKELEASLRGVRAALASYEVGEYASFVERPADASSFYDAETWSRLQAVKALYDPTDVFRGNHHIPPSH
jgi:hypothetical protein